MIKSTLHRSLVARSATCALHVMSALVSVAVSGCGARVAPVEVPAEPRSSLVPKEAPAEAPARAAAGPGAVREADPAPPRGPQVAGESPRPGGDATEGRPAAGGTLTLDAPGPAELQALAAALTEAQVSSLALGPLEEGCPELPAQASLVALSLPGGAQACAVGQGRKVCVPAVRDPDKQRQALCAAAGAAGAAAPASWSPTLEQALAPLLRTGWQVRSLAASGQVALAAYDPGGAVNLLVRDGARWQALREALPPAEAHDPHAGPRAVLPAAGLGHGARYAVVTDEYEGGSESGWQTTWLLVLCDSGGSALTLCARKAIGALVWSLGPGERARKARGAASLTGRPHLEVSLAPRLDATATVQLKLIRRTLPAKLRARFQLTPPECEPSGDQLAPGGCDPWSALGALRADAGRWRFDGQALLRDGGPR